MAIPNWKLHFIIEGSGAVVVGEESCVGERNFRNLLDKNFAGIDEALEKMAGRYLEIDCACFTPNDERLENIKSMAQKLNAGSCAYNPCWKGLLEKSLGRSVRVSSSPEMAGALGAALLAEQDPIYTLPDGGILRPSWANKSGMGNPQRSKHEIES